nr:hypothetical protein [Ktedonobacteraceae bacterium]
MYCTSINLYGSKSYPLALAMIYADIAETYRLPDLRLLQQSVTESVQWPDASYSKLEVYFLDNLMDAQEETIISLRFATGKDVREKVALSLSTAQSQVLNISIQFPGKTGRGAASNVLATIKSVAHQLRFRPDELEFEVQGFPEQGQASYIREH